MTLKTPYSLNSVNPPRKNTFYTGIKIKVHKLTIRPTCINTNASNRCYPTQLPTSPTLPHQRFQRPIENSGRRTGPNDNNEVLPLVAKQSPVRSNEVERQGIKVAGIKSCVVLTRPIELLKKTRGVKAPNIVAPLSLFKKNVTLIPMFYLCSAPTVCRLTSRVVK